MFYDLTKNHRVTSMLYVIKSDKFFKFFAILQFLAQVIYIRNAKGHLRVF